MRPIEELMSHLSDDVRDKLEAGGYDASQISNAVDEHIQGLYNDIAELDVKTHKEIGRVNAMNDRMLKVLTKLNDEVMPRYAPDRNDELVQKHTGSERGDFEWGEYCGFTRLANILGDILLEKDDENVSS